MKKLTYLTLLLLFIFSCKKKNDDISLNLPEFSLEVDGERIQGTFNHAFWRSGQLKIPISIVKFGGGAFLISDLKKGTYQFGRKYPNSIIFTKRNTDIGFHTNTTFSSGGSLTIDNFNEKDSTISGTFAYTIASLKDTTNTITIKNGVFKNIPIVSNDKSKMKGSLNGSVDNEYSVYPFTTTGISQSGNFSAGNSNDYFYRTWHFSVPNLDLGTYDALELVKNNDLRISMSNYIYKTFNVTNNGTLKITKNDKVNKTIECSFDGNLSEPFKPFQSVELKNIQLKFSY